MVELPDDLDLTDIEIFLLSGMSGYRQWCIRAVSRVRGCTPNARDCWTRSPPLSMIRHSTPNATSCAASASPVGPATTHQDLTAVPLNPTGQPWPCVLTLPSTSLGGQTQLAEPTPGVSAPQAWLTRRSVTRKTRAPAR